MGSSPAGPRVTPPAHELWPSRDDGRFVLLFRESTFRALTPSRCLNREGSPGIGDYPSSSSVRREGTRCAHLQGLPRSKPVESCRFTRERSLVRNQPRPSEEVAAVGTAARRGRRRSGPEDRCREGGYLTSSREELSQVAGPVLRIVVRLLSLAAVVLERDREADAVGRHLAVLDGQVLPYDLGDA